MGVRRSVRQMPRLDPAAADRLAALALLGAIALQAALAGRLPQPLPEGAAALVLAACVAARRAAPLGALVLLAAALASQEAVGGHLTHHSAGALAGIAMVFYSAGGGLPERRSWWALAAGLAGLGADVMIGEPGLGNVLFPAAFLAVLPWSLGRVSRERDASERAERDRAERLDAEREQRTLSAKLGERTRIARELHDVIAHSVSVMVIQASGARTVMSGDPASAERSLAVVGQAGRDALAEMRLLLGVLGERGDPRELAPQPGLRDIGELVRRTRAAGTEAELRVYGTAVPVAAALDLCAYRIVQEALTNTIKHARGASAVVEVRWGSELLELDVRDDGAAPSVRPRGGHGIVGMRERAALHGGSVRAEAGPRGGFEVRARLPLGSGGIR